MSLRHPDEPSHLQQPFVLLQRFFYKLCEMRKVSCSWRVLWRDAWSCFATRQSFLLGFAGPLSCPCWQESDRRTKWMEFLQALEAEELEADEKQVKRRRTTKAAVQATIAAKKVLAMQQAHLSQRPHDRFFPPCLTCKGVRTISAKSYGQGQFECSACAVNFRWKLTVTLTED